MPKNNALDKLLDSVDRERYKKTKEIINKFDLEQADHFATLFRKLLIEGQLIVEKYEDGFNLKMKKYKKIDKIPGLDSDELSILASFLIIALFEKFETGEIRSAALTKDEKAKVESIIASLDKDTYLHIISSLKRNSDSLIQMDYNLCTSYIFGENEKIKDNHVILQIHYSQDLYSPKKILKLALTKIELKKIVKKINEIQEKMEGDFD